MVNDYQHQEITDKILKGFYKVYNALGYGFQEKVYANALAIELRKMGLTAIREEPIDVYYEDEVVGDFSADILVENLVIIETKAKREIIADYEAQLLNYLKSTIYEVGLLLNFGPEPQVRRKVFSNSRKGSLSWLNPKFKQQEGA